MGHHWREPRPQAGNKPSPLMEFLGLLLSVFHPEDPEDKWLPFDLSSSTFRRKPNSQV